MVRSTPTKRFRIPLALSAVCALLLAGCTMFTPPKPKPTPTVLEMAHVDGFTTGDPSATWFADEVARVSHGLLVINRRLSCCGEDQSQMERGLILTVADGTSALGWVGTRVFQTIGDDDFTALTLPMHVDSYATQQAIASSALPAQMMKGLSKFAVKGLAVMPGFLRKPLAASSPLVAVDDWRGKAIFLFPGGSAAHSLAALDAIPIEGGEAGERDDGLTQHRLDGTELSLSYAADDTSRIGYVTANVNLWPRMSALLINPAVYRFLTKQQRGWLTKAIHTTIARTSELAKADLRYVRLLCQHGVELDWATPDQLSELRTAFAPVVDAAEASATTAGFVRQIDGLRRPDPRSLTVQPCL